MHITICNKSYYGQCNINAIHKGDRCMWNMIVAFVVLAYVKYDNHIRSTAWRVVCSPIIVFVTICEMASNIWQYKQDELLGKRWAKFLIRSWRGREAKLAAYL